MKEFFKLDKPYKFEYNDVRALLTVLNVALVIFFGVSIAWIGLTIALVGVVKDLRIDRRINGLVMHSATAALNIYLLTIL